MSELIGGWVAGLTATLIGEGINKRRAREIAQGYWEAYCKDDAETEAYIKRLRQAVETACATLDHAAAVADRPGLMGRCERAADALRAALAEPKKKRTVKKCLTDDGWKKTREYCS